MFICSFISPQLKGVPNKIGELLAAPEEIALMFMGINRAQEKT